MGISSPKNDDSNENVINDNYIIGNINVRYTKYGINILNYDKRNIRKKNIPYNELKNLKIEEEEYLRKNCEIFINGEKINFCFSYLFPKEGNNEIKYKFKTLINSTAFMFHECRSIISLDFSNFKSENVVNMEDMFSSCESLEFINFSNMKTEKVTSMDNMFA